VLDHHVNYRVNREKKLSDDAEDNAAIALADTEDKSKQKSD